LPVPRFYDSMLQSTPCGTAEEDEVMAKPSLQSKMDESGDVVCMLRNSKIGMYVYPVVASEFSNWPRR
jgi:hypothetical protein